VRLQRFLPLGALAGLIAATLAAAAPPQPRFLRTTTPVNALAMNGSTVTMATEWSAGHCEQEVAWNPVRASLGALGRQSSCDATSTGRGIAYQAVAGSRVAWVRDGGGNQHDSQLLVASLAKPQTARLLATATRDIDSGAGDTIGDVRGSGSLLVYASWSVCDTGEVAFRRCPAGVTPGTIFNAKLWRIEGTTGKKLLASTPDEVAPLAVAAGRILVQRGDGSLELRAADGHVLKAFSFDFPVQQAALGPTKLVVAVREAVNQPLPKGRLQFGVYDLATGVLEHTFAPPQAAQAVGAPTCSFPTGSSPAACLLPAARLRFQDADASRFLYVLDTTLHVARLADGVDRTYGVPGRPPVLAQLEPPGLVYSYRTTTRFKGRIQFVPSGELR
jgi:hypothetical protein